MSYSDSHQYHNASTESTHVYHKATLAGKGVMETNPYLPSKKNTYVPQPARRSGLGAKLTVANTQAAARGQKKEVKKWT
jgi:hypothetical protein